MKQQVNNVLYNAALCVVRTVVITMVRDAHYVSLQVGLQVKDIVDRPGYFFSK